eukprot:390594_1
MSQRSAKWLTALRKCGLLQFMTKLKKLGIASCDDFIEYEDNMQLIYISCQIPLHQIKKLMIKCNNIINSTQTNVAINSTQTNVANNSHLISQYSPRNSLTTVIEEDNDIQMHISTNNISISESTGLISNNTSINESTGLISNNTSINESTGLIS